MSEPVSRASGAQQEEVLARAGRLVGASVQDDTRPEAHREASARLLERLARPSAGGRRKLVVAGAALTAAAAGLALVWSLRQAPAPLTYVVDAEVSGVAVSRASVLTFSDGSRVVLPPSARGRVETLRADGADVALDRGEARVDIVPRARRRWTVRAGPYRIRVRGTTFDVWWDDQRQRLEVRLWKGSLEVEGPSMARATRLEAGQRLTAETSGALVNVEPLAATQPAGQAPLPPAAEPTEAARAAGTPAVAVPASPAPERAAGMPAAAVPVSPAPAVTPPPPPSPVAVAASPASPSAVAGRPHSGERPHAGERTNVEARTAWPELIARGQYHEVLGDAERQGVDRCLARCSPMDLQALGDAARLRGRADVAADALEALRRRFPNAPAARTAAFLRGRLDEERRSDPRSALSWYDRYLRESPRGPYAGDALGRKMLLHKQLGDLTAARSAAADYLRRFPQGPYAPSARELP